MCKKIVKTLHEKTKFFIKNFFSKCDQIGRKLRIWSHLVKKFLMKNSIICAVRDLFLGILGNISKNGENILKKFLLPSNCARMFCKK